MKAANNLVCGDEIDEFCVAPLHKARDIVQDRYCINAMMQSTLPDWESDVQGARQHLRALQV